MATQVCVICGKAKGTREGLKHKNEVINKKFTICKDCANKTANFNDQQAVIDVCQLTNIPYVHSIAQKLMSDNDKVDFGMYMRKLAPYKRYNTFADSEFLQETNSDDNIAVTDKVVQRWGEGYDPEKYAYFEAALTGLMAIKAATTSLEVERYVQNVKLKDVLNEALQGGDYKAISQLRKAYNDDLKELGFDSVLNAKDDSGESLGQRIQKYETTRPIPDRAEFEDASQIKKYIEKWFIIPLKRTFGLANEKEVESLYDEK